MPLRHDVVVIGLNPSEKTEVDWPLYARDEACTGGRLAQLFNWNIYEYHEKTLRVNAVMVRGIESTAIVREGVRRVSQLIEKTVTPGTPRPLIVGLGVRVCDAMLSHLNGLQLHRSILIPHPSGRNRKFNNVEFRKSVMLRLRDSLSGNERRAPKLSFSDEIRLLDQQHPGMNILDLWPRLPG